MLSATYPCMCAQYLRCVCQTAAYGDVIPGDFMVNTHPGTGTGTETGTFLSFTVNPKTLAVSCNSRETHTPTPGTSLKPVSLSPSPDTITPTLTGEAFVLHTIGEMGLIPGRQGWCKPVQMNVQEVKTGNVLTFHHFTFFMNISLTKKCGLFEQIIIIIDVSICQQQHCHFQSAPCSVSYREQRPTLRPKGCY